MGFSNQKRAMWLYIIILFLIVLTFWFFFFKKEMGRMNSGDLSAGENLSNILLDFKNSVSRGGLLLNQLNNQATTTQNAIIELSEERKQELLKKVEEKLDESTINN